MSFIDLKKNLSRVVNFYKGNDKNKLIFAFIMLLLISSQFFSGTKDPGNPVSATASVYSISSSPSSPIQEGTTVTVSGSGYVSSGDSSSHYIRLKPAGGSWSTKQSWSGSGSWSQSYNLVGLTEGTYYYRWYSYRTYTTTVCYTSTSYWFEGGPTTTFTSCNPAPRTEYDHLEGSFTIVGNNQPPNIQSMTRASAAGTYKQDMRITVTATDDGSISAANSKLYWSMNGGSSWIPTNGLSLISGGSDTYYEDIPSTAMDWDQTVYYKAIMMDNEGVTQESSVDSFVISNDISSPVTSFGGFEVQEGTDIQLQGTTSDPEDNFPSSANPYTGDDFQFQIVRMRSGVQQIFNINANQWDYSTKTFYGTFASSNFQFGDSLTIKAYSRDRGGNADYSGAVTEYVEDTADAYVPPTYNNGKVTFDHTNKQGGGTTSVILSNHTSIWQVQVKDDGVGVRDIVLQYASANSPTDSFQFSTDGPQMSLISGDIHDGIWEGSIPAFTYSETGKYVKARIRVTDLAGDYPGGTDNTIIIGTSDAYEIKDGYRPLIGTTITNIVTTTGTDNSLEEAKVYFNVEDTPSGENIWVEYKYKDIETGVWSSWDYAGVTYEIVNSASSYVVLTVPQWAEEFQLSVHAYTSYYDEYATLSSRMPDPIDPDLTFPSGWTRPLTQDQEFSFTIQVNAKDLGFGVDNNSVTLHVCDRSLAPYVCDSEDDYTNAYSMIQLSGDQYDGLYEVEVTDTNVINSVGYAYYYVTATDLNDVPNITYLGSAGNPYSIEFLDTQAPNLVKTTAACCGGYINGIQMNWYGEDVDHFGFSGIDQAAEVIIQFKISTDSTWITRQPTHTTDSEYPERSFYSYTISDADWGTNFPEFTSGWITIDYILEVYDNQGNQRTYSSWIRFYEETPPDATQIKLDGSSITYPQDPDNLEKIKRNEVLSLYFDTHDDSGLQSLSLNLGDFSFDEIGYPSQVTLLDDIDDPVTGAPYDDYAHTWYIITSAFPGDTVSISLTITDIHYNYRTITLQFLIQDTLAPSVTYLSDSAEVDNSHATAAFTVNDIYMSQWNVMSGVKSVDIFYCMDCTTNPQWTEVDYNEKVDVHPFADDQGNPIGGDPYNFIYHVTIPESDFTGLYRFRLDAEDYAGNVMATSYVNGISFTDKKDPIITELSIDQGYIETYNDFDVTLRLADREQGFASDTLNFQIYAYAEYGSGPMDTIAQLWNSGPAGKQSVQAICTNINGPGITTEVLSDYAYPCTPGGPDDTLTRMIPSNISTPVINANDASFHLHFDVYENKLPLVYYAGIPHSNSFSWGSENITVKFYVAFQDDSVYHNSYSNHVIRDVYEDHTPAVLNPSLTAPVSVDGYSNGQDISISFTPDQDFDLDPEVSHTLYFWKYNPWAQPEDQWSALESIPFITSATNPDFSYSFDTTVYNGQIVYYIESNTGQTDASRYPLSGNATIDITVDTRPPTLLMVTPTVLPDNSQNTVIDIKFEEKGVGFDHAVITYSDIYGHDHSTTVNYDDANVELLSDGFTWVISGVELDRKPYLNETMYSLELYDAAGNPINSVQGTTNSSGNVIVPRLYHQDNIPAVINTVFERTPNNLEPSYVVATATNEHEWGSDIIANWTVLYEVDNSGNFQPCGAPCSIEEMDGSLGVTGDVTWKITFPLFPYATNITYRYLTQEAGQYAVTGVIEGSFVIEDRVAPIMDLVGIDAGFNIRNTNITVSVADLDSGISHVTGSYSSDGYTYYPTNLTQVNGYYTFSIPAMDLGREVSWKIMAYDVAGNAVQVSDTYTVGEDVGINTHWSAEFIVSIPIHAQTPLLGVFLTKPTNLELIEPEVTMPNACMVIDLVSSDRIVRRIF